MGDTKREFVKLKKKLKLRYHEAASLIEEREVVKKRKRRGRPPKGEKVQTVKEYCLQIKNKTKS